MLRTLKEWFKPEGNPTSRRSRLYCGTYSANNIEASSELETEQWTMAHGHLLAMGGMSLVDPSFERDKSKNPVGQVLTIEQYGKTIAEGTFQLPKITEADIRDKLKADFLAKLIAILQTTWFILQCLARLGHQQQLALTELELVTLALASLNAITYAFWWNKPLGVQSR